VRSIGGGANPYTDKDSPYDSIADSVNHAHPMGLQTVFAITHSDPSIPHTGFSAITEIEILFVPERQATAWRKSFIIGVEFGGVFEANTCVSA
jgi:hypothetical protein